jgi:hypothetical protein
MIDLLRICWTILPHGKNKNIFFRGAWQTPKRCELNGFGPHASGGLQGDKAIKLAFWAAFLWYFLFLQKESTGIKTKN